MRLCVIVKSQHTITYTIVRYYLYFELKVKAIQHYILQQSERVKRHNLAVAIHKTTHKLFTFIDCIFSMTYEGSNKPFSIGGKNSPVKYNVKG